MADENRPYRFSVKTADFDTPEEDCICETNDLDVAFITARNELADENGKSIVWIYDEVLEIDIPLKVAS